MRIIGHRGAAGLAPENSLAGLRLAHELGVWAVEIDIQLSRDGIPVLLHDPLLDRTTNAVGRLSDFDYGTLSHQVRLANDEPLPRLEQALDLIADSDILFYLELIDPLATNKVYNLATARLPRERLVISSFHHALLRDLKARDPKLRTMALFVCSPIDPVELVRACAADEAGMALRCVSEQSVQHLHDAGIPVYVWTVNETADRERMAAMGVDGIFTDYPAPADCRHNTPVAL